MTSLIDELNALQQRVTEGLRHVPGAVELYLFGSRLSSPDDPYADLDLVLVSADMARTRVAWPQALCAIGSPELIWPIAPGGDNTAFAVLFSGVSCYHKLDIGVCAAGARPPSPARLLWRQAAPVDAGSMPQRAGYWPAHGSAGHTLFDDLLGAARYVKARKRGQHLTCLRFMRSKPERLLQLRAEQLWGWPAPARALSTWDYKALDAALPAGECDALLSRLDWSTPAAMDRALVWFSEQAAQLALARVAVRGESVPREVVMRQLRFLRAELAVTDAADTPPGSAAEAQSASGKARASDS
jgi:hypothetical protein